MAAAHVQYLGGVYTGAAHTTTVIAPASKTVAIGDKVVVGWWCYYNITPSGVTDNLGNTYARIERTTRTAATSDLWYAPITYAGTISAITVTHASTKYTAALASEFSGVGTLSASGAGLTGTGVETGTWVDNKTIPASGLAVGAMCQNNNTVHYAGAASGTPSTTISLSFSFDGGDGTATVSLSYAIASSTDVTGFVGTTDSDYTGAWACTGGLFNPAASSGPAALQGVNGLVKASVKTVNGLAIASVKTWDGLA